jgi:hypothetical protein
MPAQLPVFPLDSRAPKASKRGLASNQTPGGLRQQIEIYHKSLELKPFIRHAFARLFVLCTKK